MKKYLTIIIAAAALLVAGCTRESLQGDFPEDIVIRITPDELSTKSAPSDNEKKVTSLYVYVFKSDGETLLYYSGKIDSPALVSGENYYERSIKLSDMASGTGESDVKSAVVFALANYPGSDLTGNETLAQLKAKQIPSTTIKADELVMWAEGGFTGSPTETVSSLSLRHVAAKVVLRVKFPSTITTTGTDNTLGTPRPTQTTWKPMTGGTNFRVMLSNAVGSAVVDGRGVASPSYFDYGIQYMAEDGTGGEFLSPAFYTYPVSWTDGSADEPFIKVILPWSFVTTAEQDGSTVTINRSTVERYYKIMLTGLDKFESNKSYVPEVTLTVKAGEENEPILVMPDGMQVLPWGLVGGADGAQLSNVVITDRKFISLASSDLAVGRGATASFDVFASGPLSMSVRNIYRTKFIPTHDPSSLSKVGTDLDGNGGRRSDYIVKDGALYSYTYTDVNGVSTSFDYTALKDESGLSPLEWVSYDDNGYGGVLTLRHSMSTDINSVDFAVTPYVYELRLTLDSDPTIYKDVEIVQTPSILATNVLSEGYVYINNLTNRNEAGFTTQNDVTTDYPVYVTERMSSYFYNVNSTSKNAVAKLGYLPRVNLDGYTTKSKFRFLFSVVPYDNAHTVADTRTALSTDDAYAFMRKGSDLSYASGLPITQSYYTAIADASNVYYLGATPEPDFVSPGFMVASSYGAISGSVHFGGALLRCATYQEDGYPAGRWRLPTEAELLFIRQLQEKNIVPKILADGTWASSGRVYTEDHGFGNPDQASGHTCRCVYDTWYWGKESVVDKTTYTVKVTK